MPDLDILIKAAYSASSSGAVKAATKDVDELGNKAKSSNSLLSTLTGTLGTALKVGALAGVAGLGALGAAVVTTGVNFDNMKQQADIAFTTMLGSGEKAKVFLDDLQDFAAATPFEFPELLQASQRLLAMGFAAEDVKPTLTAVGDAVAALGGTGELVGRVTTALGQMQAKGKASAEEMGQLTEAGIPGWKFLAEAIGTDVAGAMEMVSKGAVDAKTVITAVTDGMNKDFGGMMEKQSQTFGGLLSTLKDTFTQVSGTVMAPLFDLMTEGLKNVAAWISTPEFKQGVEDFAANTKIFVETAVTNISALVESLSGTFNTISGRITTAMGWIRLAWDVDLGGMRTKAEEFMTLDKDFELFFQRLNLVFSNGQAENDQSWATWLANTIGVVTSWVRVVLENFGMALLNIDNMFGQWQAVMSGDWETFWELVKNNFENALTGVLNFIEFIFGPGVRDMIVFSFGGILVELQATWAGIVAWWDGVKSFIDGIRSSLGLGGASLPSFDAPSLNSGGSFGSTSSVTTGPINVTFNGPVSEQTVRSAGNTIQQELRRRGS